MSNHEDERSVFLNFLAGMGVGALLGAVAALMMAPKSGPETRQDIKNAADEFGAKAKKVVQDLSECSEELVQKSKELLEATKEKVQAAVDSGKQAMISKKEELGGSARESKVVER